MNLDSYLELLLPQPLRSSHGQGDNAIEQRHVIVYGRQGVGKSNCARWLTEQAVKRYGSDNVNVQTAFGEKFHDLLASSDWTTQPVQILVVEDLTNVKIRDADLRDFFRIRHIMAERTGLMEGLCLVIFTCHRFHDTPISFRGDYDSLIVLSAPVNDYDVGFIENKITATGVSLLDDAESARKLGEAIITYRRKMIGHFHLPVVGSHVAGRASKLELPTPIVRNVAQRTKAREDALSSGSIYCAVCGATQDGVEYCTNCGHDLSEQPPEGRTSIRDFRTPSVGTLEQLIYRIKGDWRYWDLPLEDKKAVTIGYFASAAMLLYGLTILRVGWIVLGLLGLGFCYYVSDRKRLNDFRGRMGLT